MVTIFGTHLVDAYTNGTSVNKIYAKGELVWQREEPFPPGTNYIKWTPSTGLSGTFWVSGNSYSYSDFNGIMSVGSEVTGVIFSLSSWAYTHYESVITTFETNALMAEVVSYAFYSCSDLSYVSGLSYCSRVNEAAFCDCRKLESIDLPECTYIGDSAFERCWMVSSLCLPLCSYIGVKGLAGLGISHSNIDISLPECLYVASGGLNATKCSSIYLPKCTYFGGAAGTYASVVNLPVCTEIRSYALYGTSSLVSIHLPKCTIIGSSAFEKCSALYSISARDLSACKRIEDYAFYECDHLTYIYLSVCSYIGAYAFLHCESLRSVYLMSGAVVSIKSKGGLPAASDIYVPYRLYSQYLSRYSWMSSQIHAI